MGKVVKAVVGIVATVVGVVTGQWWLVAAGVALTMSSVMAPPKPTTNAATEQRLSKKLEPETFRKIVFGKTAAGADLRYWEVFGADANRYIEVLAAATHKVHSFGAFSINEAPASYAHMTRSTYVKGQSGGGSPRGGHGKWTALSSMTGCAYYILDYTYKQEWFPQGISSRYTQEIEGALVYDPRRDVRFGGTHVITDQDTWEYAPLDSNGVPIGRNNALQMLWYQIGWRINGKLVAGKGVDPNDLDLDSFIQAANDCELMGWYSDCILSTGDNHDTNEGVLEAASQGKILDTGGRFSYYVAIDDTANVAVEFDHDDIIGEGFDWQPRDSMSTFFNEVAGTFVDPAALYQPRPFPMVFDQAYYDADGKKERDTVALGSVQDPAQAQKLMRIKLNKSRFQGEFSATFSYKAMRAQNYSIVTLAMPELGWTTPRLFRIISYGIAAMGGIDLTLREEHPSIYGGGTVQALPPPSEGTGTNPFLEIAVGFVNATAITEQGGDGSAIDGVKLSYPIPHALTLRTELLYRKVGDVAWVTSTIDKDTTETVVKPLQPLTPYEFRVRHVSIYGIPGPWSDATTQTANTTVETADRVVYPPIFGEPVPVPVSELRPAQAGADVTGQNTALNTMNVGVKSAQELLDEMSALGDAATGIEAIRTAAEAARDAAANHETNAELARDIAEGHVEGAALQASLAAEAKNGVIAMTRNGFFDQGKAGWEDFGLLTPIPYSAPWSNTLRTGASINSNVLGSRITIAAGAPRYRLKIRYRTIAGLNQSFYSGMFFYDANDTLVAASDGTGNYPLGANNIVPGAPEAVEREIVIGRGGNAETELLAPFGGTVIIPAGAVYMRPVWYYNYNAVVGGISEIDYFTVDDVTSEAASAKSAKASFDSATTAIAKADEAGDYAQAADTDRIAAEGASGLAEIARAAAVTAKTDAEGARNTAVDAKNLTVSTYNDAVVLTGNTNFDQGLAGLDLGGPIKFSPLYDGRRNVLYCNAGEGGEIYTQKIFPIDTTRKYRVRGEVYASGGGGILYAYVGLRCFDAAGNILISNPGSYMYAANLSVPAGTGWQIVDSLSPLSNGAAGAPITGEGTGSWAIFPPGTKGAQLLCLLYDGNTTGAKAVNFLELSDVTEMLASRDSASASAISASSAETFKNQAGVFSASAATYVGLAASATYGGLGRNGGFDDYPVAGFGNLPTGWSTWAGGVGGTRRVADGKDGWSTEVSKAGSLNVGFLQYTDPGTVAPNSWFALEVEAELVSGANWNGAGIYCPIYNAAGSVAYAAINPDGSGYDPIIEFSYRADTGGVVSNTKLGRRSWTLLFKTSPDANVSRVIMYAMAGSAGFNAAADSKVFTFHRLSLRPATQTEVQLKEATTGFTNLDGRLTDIAAVAAGANGVTAAKVTTLEARAATANLLPKSQFFPGAGGNFALDGWTGAGDLNAAFGVHPNDFWAPPPERPMSVYFYDNSGSYYDVYSPVMSVESGKRYCASAYVGKVGHNSNPTYIIIEFYGAGIGYVYASGDASSYHYNEKTAGLNIGSDYKRVWQFGTAPAGAQTARVLYRHAPQGATATAFTFRPMFSEATAAQTQAPPWAPSASEARIVEAFKATSDLRGRVEATGGLTFQAGSRVSGVRFHAQDGTDVNYSSIDFLTDIFRVWDTVTQTGRAPFEIRDGGVRMRSAFVDRLAVGVSLTVGTANLKVAVQPFDMAVTDGQVVSFGYDLGLAPNIDFKQTGLVSLGSGEVYKLYADSLSPTGFTARLKIETPGAPSNVTLGPTGHTVISSPPALLEQQRYLGGVPATSGDYSIRVTGTVRVYFDNPQYNPGGSIEAPDGKATQDGFLTLSVRGYNGSWAQIDTIDILPPWMADGSHGNASGYYDVPFDVTEIVHANSDVTYLGIGTLTESYPQSYLDTWTISFQTASGSSTRSATPAGQISSVTVRPKNA